MHNLKLTTDQFKTLLKLVYIGEWVINSHKIDEQDKDSSILLEHLFSLTKQFKIPNFSDNENPQYPTYDYEFGEVRQHIDEYDEYSFWEALEDKLIQKILLENYTSEQLQALEKERRFKIICDIEENVQKHLLKHGLEQIVIKYSP